MSAKVVLFVALLAVASSKVLISRRCDPERTRETPTLCSNYLNIVQLDKIQTKVQEKQMQLEKKIEAIEAVCAILNLQKAEVDKFKKDTDSKFSHINKQLEAQKTTTDKQQAQIEALRNNTAGIKSGLGWAEEKASELDKLKLQVKSIQTDVSAKVAFSATISEFHGAFTGPGNHSSILIFDRVFTNFGNAYNRKTGIFTAPLKGVYHFSFMTFGYSSHTSGAILVKNGHYQVSTWEFKGADTSDTTSNTVVLQLKPGETVNIILLSVRGTLEPTTSGHSINCNV